MNGYAFTSWNMASEFVSDDWFIINLVDVGPNFNFGYDGGIDFTKVHALGLEITSNGKKESVTGVIQIDNVTIY